MSRISQKILAKPKVYMDKEYDLGGGELELIRIYKPTVADWNWFQSKVADASAEGQKVSLPPDIYADIVIRAAHDPENGQRIFLPTEKDAIKNSDLECLLQIANDWIGMLTAGRERAVKNSEAPTAVGE